MKLKNVICFEEEKDGKFYRLTMPHGAPLGEAYDVVNGFLGELAAQIVKDVQKNPKQEEKPEEPKEESKEEA